MHAIQRHAQLGLVESALVGPRTAVDVVADQVAPALSHVEGITRQMLEVIHLARAGVNCADDLDRAHRRRIRQWEVAQAVAVIEQRREEKQPAAGGKLHVADGIERHGLPLCSLLDGHAEQQPAFALSLLPEEERLVTLGVAVGQRDLRVVRGRALVDIAVDAAAQVGDRQRRQVGQEGVLDREVRGSTLKMAMLRSASQWLHTNCWPEKRSPKTGSGMPPSSGTKWGW